MSNEKEKIWNLLVKYDNTLLEFCDSLSSILQNKSSNNDFLNIVKNYKNIESEDVLIIDSILGDSITNILNDF
jgi:archaellum biogenesis ATPase FlaH